MTPIYGEWTPPSEKRCDRKRFYYTMRKASEVAARQSLQTGHLLIAYECPDCGAFHVGHADRSQQIIRQQQDEKLPRTCARCGEQVSQGRRLEALGLGAEKVYCSELCQSEHGNSRQRRQQKMKLTREQREKAFADAEASLALSGLYPSPFCDQLKERVLNGELTTEQAIEELEKHYDELVRNTQ